jgi:hypothetical protein
MSLKIITGELGYMLDIDGIESESHRYGHAIVAAGPSGTMYAAYMKDADEKPQLYRLVPVDSLHEEAILDEDVEGGYVEDLMYDDDDDDDDDECDGDGDGDGDEVEDEAEGEDDDDDDDDDDNDEGGDSVEVSVKG